MSIPDDIVQAYRKTNYHVEGELPFVLKIGRQFLQSLLAKDIVKSG
jgi:hypothetical protein